MKNQEQNVNQHLRIMHACEKGATGVYYGHRLVAALFYRDLITALTDMHTHEMEHYNIFSALMKSRGAKGVFLPVAWCGGGIIYGVFTALLGRNAIWKSTATIEAIVEKELIEAADSLKNDYFEIYTAIHKILIDEIQHKEAGEAYNGQGRFDYAVSQTATYVAVLAKKLAIIF